MLLLESKMKRDYDTYILTETKRIPRLLISWFGEIEFVVKRVGIKQQHDEYGLTLAHILNQLRCEASTKAKITLEPSNIETRRDTTKART